MSENDDRTVSVERTKETEVVAAPVTTDAAQAKDPVPLESTETTTVSEKHTAG